MMSLRSIFSVSLAVILTGAVVSTRAQEVSVPDPGLNAAIREALQKPFGPLTEQDLVTLTNLTSLVLAGNQLTNLVLPSDLSQLVEIELGENNFDTETSVPSWFGERTPDCSLSSAVVAGGGPEVPLNVWEQMVQSWFKRP